MVNSLVEKPRKKLQKGVWMGVVGQCRRVMERLRCDETDEGVKVRTERAEERFMS